MERVKPRLGTRCPRCGHHHWSTDTTVCEACWVDLGQMALWEDADEDVIERDQWDHAGPDPF